MTKENVKQFDNSSQEESSQEQTNDIIGKKVLIYIILNVPFSIFYVMVS